MWYVDAMWSRHAIVVLVLAPAWISAAEEAPTYVPLAEGSSWTYRDTRRSGE